MSRNCGVVCWYPFVRFLFLILFSAWKFICKDYLDRHKLLLITEVIFSDKSLLTFCRGNQCVANFRVGLQKYVIVRHSFLGSTNQAQGYEIVCFLIFIWKCVLLHEQIILECQLAAVRLKLHIFRFLAEPKPESSHIIAQILWVVLRTIGWQEHSDGGHEQRAAQGGAHAPQIWHEGIHLQATGLQERAWKGETHL